ncbi:MAG: hypothetical protein WBN40_01815 [Pseudomonadales bacterium]
MYKILCGLFIYLFCQLAVAEGQRSPGSFVDPTRPPGQVSIAKPQAKTYRLQSILYSTVSSRSLAIINGKSYAIGEQTPLGLLEQIDRDSISLRGAGKRVVKLHRDLNKQMVAGKQ